MTTFRQAIRSVMNAERAEIVLTNAAKGNKVLTGDEARAAYVLGDAL